ncbi:MAG: cold shock domain-containing protein [Parafilimonas sp.]
MARKETWNKKENEKKKQKRRKDKEQKREERKANAVTGKSLEDMMAYVDENGNISSTPPDVRKRINIKQEDIEIGVPKHVPAEIVRKGIVTFFNETKGYGFIKDQSTQESIFVHVNQLAAPLKESNQVTFEVESGHKGLNAVNVRVVK